MTSHVFSRATGIRGYRYRTGASVELGVKELGQAAIVNSQEMVSERRIPLPLTWSLNSCVFSVKASPQEDR